MGLVRQSAGHGVGGQGPQPVAEGGQLAGHVWVEEGGVQSFC